MAAASDEAAADVSSGDVSRVPTPFEPSLLKNPRFGNSFEHKRTSALRKPVEEEGVAQSIYTKWIKEELQKEEACLELPFSIVFLTCFALFALTYLSQHVVILVEDSIETDIIENANFAFSENFGHKNIYDVNNFADFWSWTRIGLLPLIFPASPYMYSESLDQAVPQVPGAPAYDVNALPTRRPSPGYLKPAPVQNDYLRYNRIIGGLRFRQEVSKDDKARCTYPGDENVLKKWLGKPCTHFSSHEMPPDLVAAESFSAEPQRVEFFLPEVDGNAVIMQHVIDMEDGCVSARAQNRSCLCEWCHKQGLPHPWLDDQTQRIEISFTTYNAHYGMYNLASINFWFNRAGSVHKMVVVRSSWAGLGVRDPSTLAVISAAGITWILSCLYVTRIELIDIVTMIRSSKKLWYYTLADDYLGFWNCVDWCAILMTTVICVIFGVLHLCIGNVNTLLGEMVLRADAQSYRFPPVDRYRAGVAKFDGAISEMMDTERQLRMWLCVYPFVLLSRLFKSFSAQKRLAIVSDTFIVARNDMVHFFIVFSSVYFCMTVNAVIFFGQDQLDFATLDRALPACFRAMLGDWDWDGMINIGLFKAFVWFFAFMLLMVIILLNMLLAILMEAYGTVKEDARNADSLFEQMRNMVRRAQQSKRKQRVKLTDIWDALFQESNGDEVAMLSSDRKILPSFLLKVVQGIPAAQASRTLKTAQADYDKKNDPAFELSNFKEGLTKLLTRMDYSVLCSVYLHDKIRQYQDLTTAEGLGQDTEHCLVPEVEDHPGGTASQATTGSPTTPTSSGWLGAGGGAGSETASKEATSSSDIALEQVRTLAQERSTEMADGIAAILGEEMQELERRQFEQRKSIEGTCKQLQSLREMIHKLSKTCEEIGGLAQKFAQVDSNTALALSALPASAPAFPALGPAEALPAITDDISRV
eukprot:TRINITY_DN31210_c0_g1_i1.p1 TRINITY_DN31210_c0_g1~~TRINITY_DN31210_c0_g1_i1.p1  ORF type:complete len:927 (-),score=178.82 TRINITY_DN31210_c0_g1_i1:78-2858(-)